ncbi:MAG: transglutaminase domain-containing protein [candidate division WWE3 bacterium]|nr:transglutaminase domain-containing protein [candidate division WWE3 bacterium]
MEDIKKYLKHGEQTKPLDEVIEISKSIPGDGFDFVIGVMGWLDKNLKVERNRPDWNRLFNRRTASQIIEDGFATGCTDVALAFVALCRAKSIPTKYVEVIGKDWLGDQSGKGKIHGHTFAEIRLKNKWYVVDPDQKVIYATGNPYRFFEIFGTGLDTWDVGLHSFEELRDKFLEFKKNREPQK